MTINEHNYEAYFLDYYEGNLPEEDIGVLMAFLDENPGLREEFLEYEGLRIKPDMNISFAAKNALKKSTAGKNHPTGDELLIAYLEGDLDKEEAIRVEAALHDDEHASERLVLLKSIILKPSLSIVYPKKEKLKKKTPGGYGTFKVYAYAAAAVLLLFIGLSSVIMFYTTNIETSDKPVIARAVPHTITNIAYEKASINPTMRADVSPIFTPAENERYVSEKLLPKSAIKIETTYINHNYIALYRQLPPPSYGLFSSGESLAEADAEYDKTLAGKIISGFFNKVSAPFKSVDREDEKTKGNFSIWDIAEFGVKGVNALGDHEYTLVKRYNENGNVKGFMILEE
ncbi:MAG: zf-HC2 domain-containing protein [Bacteroidales bacterium]|nr:zf-HC2 domain-containing protein [Bacteroidales bacterium]